MVSAATAAVPPGAIPSAFVLTVRARCPTASSPALLAAAANAASDRDFGPMRDAVARNEAARRAGRGGGGGRRRRAGRWRARAQRWHAAAGANALVPFGTIVAATLGGMVLDGRAAPARRTRRRPRASWRR
ncbi:Na+/H+ antiporter [Aureococcus anophagefferens]|uniref:Na+/H+ antiporter n=1 Tax=Aureococcus anophagefferens TaxID=44056 RepID=A0ABR1FNP4_AURAN